MVRAALHEAADDGFPGPCRLLPPLRQPVARCPSRSGVRDLADDQSQEPRGQHPADAAAGPAHPAERLKPQDRERGAEKAIMVTNVLVLAVAVAEMRSRRC